MTNSKSIYFIINPHSGGKDSSLLINKLEDYCISQTNQNLHLKVMVLQSFEDETILQDARRFDTIVIGGGDGTVSFFLTRLMHHKRIGVLPLGTGNDLAREYNIPLLLHKRPVSSIIEFYLNASPRPHAICLFKNGDKEYFFINYISFGYDAQVVHDFAQIRRFKLLKKIRSKWINRIAYTLLCIKHCTSSQIDIAG
jgi:diacylglycerol kinase (ATP)